MQPLRIGILAASRVAAYAVIAPARTLAGVVVTAVAARDPVRAHAYAQTHAIARVHDSYQALIDDPQVDLVYVSTPPSEHARWAHAVLAAGKPALIEKPIAMDAAQARAIREAAHAAGRPAIEAFHYRHHPLWTRILALAARLGPLRRLEAGFHASIARSPGEFRWNAALGGGGLMDLGCYCVHWLRTVTGEEPVVAAAHLTIEDGVDAEARAVLAFPSGATAQLSTSMIAPRRAWLAVEGARGRIAVENPLAPQLGSVLTWSIDGEEAQESVDGPSTFNLQLAAVRDHLRDAAPFPLTPADAERTMAVLDAIRAAAC